MMEEANEAGDDVKVFNSLNLLFKAYRRLNDVWALLEWRWKKYLRANIFNF